MECLGDTKLRVTCLGLLSADSRGGLEQVQPRRIVPAESPPSFRRALPTKRQGRPFLRDDKPAAIAGAHRGRLDLAQLAL